MSVLPKNKDNSRGEMSIGVWEGFDTTFWYLITGCKYILKR